MILIDTAAPCTWNSGFVMEDEQYTHNSLFFTQPMAIDFFEILDFRGCERLAR